jgi:uncharacterized Zn-binding protein involved in type VI secretion
MAGSPDVFVNSMKWSRQGDKNTIHVQPGSPCVPCPNAAIASGSSTVFVNNKQAGRVGDPTCTVVAMGSFDVFCG